MARVLTAENSSAELRIRIGLAAQGWGIRRAICVFAWFLLCAFDWFFRRHNPTESGSLTERSLDEGSFAGEQGQKRAHKIGGILWTGFVCLTTLDGFQDLGEAWIRTAQLGDAGIVLLDQPQ
jgi:hypothetical protein